LREQRGTRFDPILCRDLPAGLSKTQIAELLSEPEIEFRAVDRLPGDNPKTRNGRSADQQDSTLSRITCPVAADTPARCPAHEPSRKDNSMLQPALNWHRMSAL
jgi:hypothetical protein